MDYHSLDSCFLCDKPFAAGDDIYMYRGDTPFCSERCREEQIAVDAAEERLRTKQRRKIMTLAAATKESSGSSIFSSDEKMQVFCEC